MRCVTFTTKSPGVLDEPEDDEVDLTSEAFEVWSQATKANPDLRKAVEALPNVVFSTKTHVPDQDKPAFTPPGVLAYILYSARSGRTVLD